MRAFLIFVLLCVLIGCGNTRGKSSKSNKTPPNNANSSNNAPMNSTTHGAACGDGVLNAGEMCDPGITEGPGSCPVECRAPACSTARLSGSAADCTAVCSVEPVGCADGDGCCTLGCDVNSDSDCTNVCGNGIVEDNELCDGNCPSACGSPDACTLVELQGDPARCSSQCVEKPIAVCQDGDGCCPSSCNANNDSDCGATCGNGTLEPGESCDGNCPTSCDDGAACTRDTLAGSPGDCNVICLHEEIRVCADGDGCCPVGCTSANDSDCSATCGNGVVDPGETCDGNCPLSCSDGNPCTRDVRRGAASTCNVSCTNEPINVCQGGDGCCPTGCTNLNDSDCQCTPSTCQQLGVMCGPADNGCGGTLQCGTCSSGACNQGQCDSGMTVSTVGAPCIVDADCAADTVNTNPFCLTEADGYPGGYCSAACQFLCNDVISPCVGFILLEGTCHAACTTDDDCRAGYSCEEIDTGFGIFAACMP